MADTELKVRITGDLTAIRNSLAGLEQQLVQLGNRSNQAGQRAGRGLGQIEGIAGRAVKALKGLAAAYVGLEGLRGFVRIADQAATLNARLRLATKSQEDFNKAQRETFNIAQRTRTGIEATVDLYARLERSTRELNVNQDTILALTETINQAAQIGGGGPSAEAALFQLSQGLASGTLRGEELNSVLEQAPRLAQAIADGLGVPIGKLRELAKEGQLTSAAIARALLNSRDQIAQEFNQLPRTVGGALTQLSNSISRIIDRVNRETGLTDALIAGIDLAVPVIEGLANFVVNLGQQFRDAGAVIESFWRNFIDGGSEASRVTQDLGDNASSLFDRIVAEFQILPTSIRTIMAIIVGEADKFLQRLRFAFFKAAAGADQAWETVKLSGSLAFAKLQEVAGIAVDFILRRFASVQRQAADLADAAGLGDVADRLRTAAAGYENLGTFADDARAKAAAATAEYQKNVATIADTVAAFERELEAGLATTDEVIGAFLGDRQAALDALKGSAEDAAAAVGDISVPDPSGGGARAAADQGALLRDAIERSLRELQRLYDAGEIGLRDYFRERERLQTAAIDVQIAQAKAELATADSQEKQAAALTKIEILQRDRAEIGPSTAREQAAAEEELARKLEDVRARLAELQGDTTAGRRLALERERDELLKAFQDDPASQGLVNSVFNVELARTRADAIRDEASRLTTELRAIEENVAVQLEAGTLGQIEGERRLQDARAQTIQQLEALRLKLLEVLATNPTDPEALNALRQLDTEIAQVKASADTFRNQVKDVGQNSLATFFTDLATGAKSFKDAFKDMVVGFVQGIAKMIAQEWALYAVRMITRSFGGGGGATVGVNHGGGMAGSGMKRVIPAAMAAALFAGAPRFHDGGMAGLKAGEVPAILQTGERVLSRSETAAYNGGGDRPGPGYRIINAFDPSFVPDQMDSADGERVIMNLIGRNPGRINQILGR
jgi:tape measure domain-containing protein